jgi:serine/threonine-protein kinase
MTNQIMRVGLFLAVTSLSACVAEPDDELVTASDESALSRGPATWTNTATLQCLDSNPRGDVFILACNGGGFQQWTNSPLSFGDQILDKATNRCLDNNTSGDVFTLPCNGGAFQQWTVTDKGRFGFEIRSVATGLCLDSNPRGDMHTFDCNGGNFQRWL